MTVRPETIDRFRGDQAGAALVRVEPARGSTPRERGAWMAVGPRRRHRHHRRRPARVHGDRRRPGHARPRRATRTTLDIPLGPEIGQCCGGRTLLSVARLDADGWAAPAHHRRGRAPRAARGPHLRRRPRRPRAGRGAGAPAAAPGPRRQPRRGAAPQRRRASTRC